MRRVRLGPDEIFHRYLTPKWAFMPTSGAGAAEGGGRFNRPGAPALYLSRGAQTALEEYRQGAPITPPATLAAYRVNLEEVADLSDGFDPAAWSSEWAEWDCAWRNIARIDRKTPPSWVLADGLLAAGAQGLLFPSLRHPGGVNLVVFGATLTGEAVKVHDPDRLLPRDASSWPEES
jgi:RES domain-containing protein